MYYYYLGWSILTIFILMDYPIHIDTISMGLFILCFKGHRSTFLNYDAFMSLKFIFILANCADPDEMPH